MIEKKKTESRTVQLGMFFLAMVLFLSFHATYATETVYFTSVNDKVLPLEDKTMPVWIDGQIYVPYTTFDQGFTGTDHGVNASQNSTGTFVTLTGKEGVLTFDIQSQACYDEVSKISYPYKAVMRSGTAFLPVAGVCTFFNMTYSYQNIGYGYLLRIQGANTVLTDSRFIDAAKSLFASMLEEYTNPPVIQPTPEPEVEEEEEEEEELIETPLLLGIDMIDYNVNLPAVLKQRGIFAIFFFYPEQFETQGQLLRTLIGQGHTIGIKVRGSTEAEIREELELANTYFYQQCRMFAQIVSGNSEALSVVASLDYIPWLGGESQTLLSSATVLQSLPVGVRMAYLTLEQTENTAQAFQSFYLLLTEKGFQFQIPREDLL